MQEYYTKAVVLERKDAGEIDGLVYLFTEDLGKVVARAKSLRKIKSKLSAHLQPLNFIKIRLVKLAGPRDGFSVVDCLDDSDFSKLEPKNRFDLIPVLLLINNMSFELQTDRRLWAFLKKIFENKYKQEDVLKALLVVFGFDPRQGECFKCGKKEIVAFHLHDHIFFCEEHSVKIPKDKVILLK